MSILNANWIKAGESMGDVVPVFSKVIEVSDPEKALISVTSKGVYCLYINGKRVSDYVLAPGWTVYEKRLQYQTYDVTSMLKNGENKIEIGVGFGWMMHNKTFKDVKVIASVEIDGEVIVTDESWDYASSQTLFSNMYHGETFDTTKEITVLGKAVIDNEESKDVLIPQEGEIIKEHERISAKEIIVTPSGDTVIDFGQNLTGYVEFKFKGNAGDEFVITHAEVLDKDGEFYIENMRAARNEIKVICNGNERTFKPHYTFQGFRYIKLVGFTDEIKLENFTAIAVYSDMRRTGNFVCSSEMLNKLYHNIIWGQMGNFLDVPTDCPQRDERLGWTGDAEVFVKTASYNFDVYKFFTKWLKDLAADQCLDGKVPHVIPDLGWFDDEKNATSSAAWADAATICPWQIYLTYGKKEILENQFESMKKWVDYLNSINTDYLWIQDDHFGDWLGLDAEEGSYKGSTDMNLIASAYYYYSTSLVIKAGKVLGEDMTEYEEILEKIKASYIKTYLPEGKVVCNTQTACVLTLFFGLCEDKETVTKQLVDIIKEFGHMTTGFVGTPYLLHALSENGETKVAYDLLLREEYPSWLYSVTQGATTIWEHWDGIKPDGSMWSADMNSFNHYAYGAVGDWMYGVMAGINTDENAPGFKHIIFKPQTDERIDFVEASIDTAYGTVKSEWKKVDGKIVYTFTVPTGAVATAYIGEEKYAIGAGVHKFEY